MVMGVVIALLVIVSLVLIIFSAIPRGSRLTLEQKESSPCEALRKEEESEGEDRSGRCEGGGTR